MSSRTDDGETVIHVRCDPDLKTDVRVAAAEQDKSMSQYVRDTLRSSVDEDMSDV
ncbi:toxin-antitoxin system HicB family antitoxin [Halosolutus halophilus]|uniref:toxin-antitoxin system HicB family antitoxin n=1 Tax=Halosolutus halophilus TaxID=1552990 RepID=UPI003CE4A949